MESVKSTPEVPEYILTQLEDCSASLEALNHLVTTVAVAAQVQDLKNSLPTEESTH